MHLKTSASTSSRCQQYLDVKLIFFFWNFWTSSISVIDNQVPNHFRFEMEEKRFEIEGKYQLGLSRSVWTLARSEYIYSSVGKLISGI
jgi:hypothetical protein